MTYQRKYESRVIAIGSTTLLLCEWEKHGTYSTDEGRVLKFSNTIGHRSNRPFSKCILDVKYFTKTLSNDPTHLTQLNTFHFKPTFSRKLILVSFAPFSCWWLFLSWLVFVSSNSTKSRTLTRILPRWPSYLHAVLQRNDGKSCRIYNLLNLVLFVSCNTWFDWLM